MIPKLLMITASAIGLLASAEVFARPHFGGDKTIDLAAVEQKVAERQAKVDTNSDGSISEVEFLAAEGGPMVRPARFPAAIRCTRTTTRARACRSARFASHSLKGSCPSSVR